MRICQPPETCRFQGVFLFVRCPSSAVRGSYRGILSHKDNGRRPFEESPMIVVMKPGSTQKQIAHIVELIDELGLRSHIIQGTDRTVVAALGEKRDGAKQALETGDGVEKVMPILAPFKMASYEVKKERTVVRALNLKVGNGHVGVIAGPCSVESRDQILEVASIVKEC